MCEVIIIYNYVLRLPMCYASLAAVLQVGLRAGGGERGARRKSSVCEACKRVERGAGCLRVACGTGAEATGRHRWAWRATNQRLNGCAHGVAGAPITAH